MIAHTVHYALCTTSNTLLAKIGLSLLHRGHDHVADTGSGQAVEARVDALDGDDVEVLGTRVVGAVHHGAHGLE